MACGTQSATAHFMDSKLPTLARVHVNGMNSLRLGRDGVVQSIVARGRDAEHRILGRDIHVLDIDGRIFPLQRSVSLSIDMSLEKMDFTVKP